VAEPLVIKKKQGGLKTGLQSGAPTSIPRIASSPTALLHIERAKRLSMSDLSSVPPVKIANKTNFPLNSEAEY
jgi:hypothetical protein